MALASARKRLHRTRETLQSTPSVSVIIPARNAATTLGRTLFSLRFQELDAEYEVIVVDDGSRDRTPLIAQEHAPLVRLIRAERNQGAGAARNRGAREARAPVLAFTDADCFPTPRWLERGLKALDHAELVQGRVEPDPEVPRSPFDRSLTVAGDVGFYQTANLFVRREVFDAVGGFRDWTRERPNWRPGPDGVVSRPVGEDTLFGWMARRMGARAVFAPEAIVHHVVVPGGVRDAIADRWNWTTKMPGLASLVPELRETTFYRRWFFARWTARFDLAAAGALIAAASRRRLPLLALAPYVWHVWDETASYPRVGRSRISALRRRAGALAGKPVVDAVTLCGFLAGSIQWGSPLL